MGEIRWRKIGAIAAGLGVGWALLTVGAGDARPSAGGVPGEPGLEQPHGGGVRGLGDDADVLDRPDWPASAGGFRSTSLRDAAGDPGGRHGGTDGGEPAGGDAAAGEAWSAGPVAERAEDAAGG